MALVFAALSPHPPVLIPKIGGPQTEKVKKTIRALNKLAQNFNQSQPNTLIIISPHALVYPDRMNVCGMKNLQGDFSAFGTHSYLFVLKMTKNSPLKSTKKPTKPKSTPCFMITVALSTPLTTAPSSPSIS
jgi:Uncharacterized conserved protein